MLHHNLPAEHFVVHELHAEHAGVPLTDQQLWDALTRTFQSPRYQPPTLPAAASELLSVSSEREVELDRLIDLLERDVTLASRVVDLCNSPLYGATEVVYSLEAALISRSLPQLRDVVMEAALGVRIFKTAGYSEAVDRVRLHSTAVAHLARTIARFTSLDTEHVFLCGLLHDVGFSAALVALGDGLRGERLRPVVDLWPALHALHETVGGSVATLWKLPPEIGMALRLHHSMKVGEVVHPVAAIIVLAEAIAQEHGFGLVPRARKVSGVELQPLLFGPHKLDAPCLSQVLTAKAALDFDHQTMQRIRDAAAPVLAAVRLT